MIGLGLGLNKFFLGRQGAGSSTPYTPLQNANLVDWYDWKVNGDQADDSNFLSYPSRVPGGHAGVATGTPKWRTAGIQFPAEAAFDVTDAVVCPYGTVVIIFEGWSAGAWVATKNGNPNFGPFIYPNNPYPVGIISANNRTQITGPAWSRTGQSWLAGSVNYNYTSAGTGPCPVIGNGINPIEFTLSSQSGASQLTRFGGTVGGVGGFGSGIRVKHILVYNKDWVFVDQSLRNSADYAAGLRDITYLTNRDFVATGNPGGRLLCFGGSQNNQAIAYWGAVVPWFRKVLTDLNANNSAQLDLEVWPLGRAGQTGQECIDDAVTRNLFSLKSDRKPTIATIMMANNSLAANHGPTTTFNQIVDIVDRCIAAGYVPFVCGAYDRSNGFSGGANLTSYRADVITLNGLLSTYTTNESILYIDTSAVTGLNDSTNATYFSDAIHWTTTGNANFANAIRTGLASVWDLTA